MRIPSFSNRACHRPGRTAWLEVRTVAVPLDAALALLDVGEREAISLAKEIQADALIIDEPDGREAAKRQGLRVIGTLRVLYDAAEAGLCELEQTYDDTSCEHIAMMKLENL